MAGRRSMHRSMSTSARRRAAAAQSAPASGAAGPTTHSKPSDDGGDFIRSLGIDEETRALEDGDRLAASGDYEGARVAYARAWRVLRLPSVLLKLAAAEERCGRLVDALRSYGELIKLTEPGSDYTASVASDHPDVSETLKATRRHAEQKLTLLVERVGRLEVDCPHGAKVSIDGHEVPGPTDQPIWVEAGAHVIDASLGQITECVTVHCRAGTIQTITVLRGAGSQRWNPN